MGKTSLGSSLLASSCGWVYTNYRETHRVVHMLSVNDTSLSMQFYLTTSRTYMDKQCDHLFYRGTSYLLLPFRSQTTGRGTAMAWRCIVIRFPRLSMSRWRTEIAVRRLFLDRNRENSCLKWVQSMRAIFFFFFEKQVINTYGNFF